MRLHWHIGQRAKQDLLTAAGRGDLTAVNALLQKAGADVNDAKETALGPTTALMKAASNGHLEVVQALLGAKADVNAMRARDSGPKDQLGDGATALALASQNGHLNVVQALLAAKADVNGGAIPALYFATAGGNLDIIRALLAAKPNLDWRDRALGSTTLMLALAPNESVLRNKLPRTGRWDIAQLLVEAGANLNVTDKGGVTALKLVVQEKSPRGLAMVQTLLAANADVNGGVRLQSHRTAPTWVGNAHGRLGTHGIRAGGVRRERRGSASPARGERAARRQPFDSCRREAARWEYSFDAGGGEGPLRRCAPAPRRKGRCKRSGRQRQDCFDAGFGE